MSLDGTVEISFGVQGYFSEDRAGGQKDVFFVLINEKRYVIKRLRQFGPREERELEIYDNFKEFDYLPKILKHIEIGGVHYILEENIPGFSLDEIKSSYLGNAEKIKLLLTRIINILTPLWGKSIIHRDLNPKNIMIDEDENPHVIDFGIARDLDAENITYTGISQPMTRKYASPEQILSLKNLITYRTDYFCLGIITYELFYGRHPFYEDISEYGNFMRMIESNELTYYSQANDPFKNFYDGVFRVNNHERVNHPSDLMALIL